MNRISWPWQTRPRKSASFFLNDSRKLIHKTLGILLNKKCYLEISRMEKSSELRSINSSVAQRADLFDTYSIGLAFPVEL